jgi:mono/diheme cytochrome c family protein
MKNHFGYWKFAAISVLGLALAGGTSTIARAQEGGGLPPPNPNKTCKEMVLTGAGKVTSGQLEFREFCTQCHGPTGVGNGPTAVILKKKPANLTLLAKNNGGVFPEAEVKNYITGAKFIESHGTREMPLWGNQFRVRAASSSQAGYAPAATPQEINAKINRLVEYVRSLQVQ